jgi:type I restriction enzyme M protein
VTLWFLDQGKTGTPREQKVLFLDAREVFRQVDRAHRDFSEEQIEFLVNIVRLYRGEEAELVSRDNALFEERFPKGEYADVNGLCKVATIEEIEAQGWSLNPGRYVGTEVEELDDEVFEEQLAASHAELRALGARARELEDAVDGVLEQLLSESK